MQLNIDYNYVACNSIRFIEKTSSDYSNGLVFNENLNKKNIDSHFENCRKNTTIHLYGIN